MPGNAQLSAPCAAGLEALGLAGAALGSLPPLSTKGGRRPSEDEIIGGGFELGPPCAPHLARLPLTPWARGPERGRGGRPNLVRWVRVKMTRKNKMSSF